MNDAQDYKGAGFDDLMSNSPIDPDSQRFNASNLITPDQDSFNIRNGRNPRIFKQGSVDMTGSTISISVVHNLCYIPSYLAFTQSSALPTGFANVPYVLIDDLVDLEINVVITLNTILFTRNFTSSNVHIYYYIFKESAN